MMVELESLPLIGLPGEFGPNAVMAVSVYR